VAKNFMLFLCYIKPHRRCNHCARKYNSVSDLQSFTVSFNSYKNLPQLSFFNFLLYVDRFLSSKAQLTSCTHHYIPSRTLSRCWRHCAGLRMNMFPEAAPFTTQRFVQHYLWRSQYELQFDFMQRLNKR
jgi:hypothetical protein